MPTMGVEGGKRRAKREKDVSFVDAMLLFLPPPFRGTNLYRPGF